MKRDMELIRRLVLHIEDHGSREISSLDPDEQKVLYHVRLLQQANLANGFVIATLADGRGTMILQDLGTCSLTWKGHDFAEAVRNETVWNTVVGHVVKHGGGFTLSVLQNLATSFLNQQMGLGR